jgi:hypothetical protein
VAGVELTAGRRAYNGRDARPHRPDPADDRHVRAVGRAGEVRHRPRRGIVESGSANKSALAGAWIQVAKHILKVPRDVLMPVILLSA